MNRITATPNGCRHCSDSQHHHGMQYLPEAGWHSWAAPTDAQRLERMQARRAARQQTRVLRIESALWARMQQVIQELGRGYRGNSRSSVEYTPTDNGASASCTYSVWEKDGTSSDHALAATWSKGEITVDVQTTVNSFDEVWGPDGSRRPDEPNLVVIDHIVYELRPERGTPTFRGFCGRRFNIEFLADGRSVTTTNLWEIGTVPPKWRARWPDTARFATAKTTDATA